MHQRPTGDKSIIARGSDSHGNADNIGLRPDLRELIALRARVRGWPPARLGAARVAGPALSPFRGRGMEYAESRLYAAGDDARHIDWRVTARTGRAHTKLFQAERERITLLIADTSPRLYFGTRVRFKSVQAARVGAIVAWAAQRSGDRIGLLRGSDKVAPLAPTGGARGVLRVLSALTHWYAQSPADDAGLERAIVSALRGSRPRARVVLLADPLSVEPISQGHLAALCAQHDVLAVLLVDPLELEPPRERLTFRSDARRIEVDLADKRLQRAWQSQFGERIAAQSARLHALGAHVRTLRTDEDIDHLLSALLPATRGVVA
ncbi:MAG: DUF58 domain-containing protein [Lysobacteraceae bacterium]